MPQQVQIELTVPGEMRGRRLDQVLAELVNEYSRSRLQQWIRGGQVLLDGRLPQAREKVVGGEKVCINAVVEEQTTSEAEPITLDIVHEDADLLVINKPAGLVVHPAVGNPAGTLLNALLHHDARLAALPRAGIVHRLDKSTSGLMVVARNLASHKRLVEALQSREVKREYLAVVNSVLTAGGSIDAPIGRHPVDRKRMAVVSGGKESRTHYRVEERFRAHTLVRVQLETGRTHQIRVHMAYRHYPIVGDPVYGGRLRLPKSADEHVIAVLSGFRRQALHATRLSLDHPGRDERLSWQAEVPPDMTELVEALRYDARQHAGD
ncbi:MAG: 23S rRNA pseudouridine(1911/1915/1917) synthase RluD [Gammaproteobacteria bacterium]|nr:23S rRNA pseudouridine(1911/1915/1917) synthase RluD [Gammaproteobacteria bacterium]